MALELSSLVGGTAAVVLDCVWSTGTALAGLGPVKDWAAGMRARAAGRLALPVNHTLVRTIRTAHLTAVDKITRRHADLLLDLPRRDIHADEPAFNEAIRGFLDRRLKLLRDDTDIATVSEAEVQHVLDEMVHPSSIEGYAEAAATNRRQAEARALAELEAHAGFHAPPLYRRLFIGEAAPGWYETFGLFVNEQIKSNEAFRSIFLSAELVDVKRLVAAMDARIAAALIRGVHRLEKVEAKIDAVKDDTAVIKTMLDQVLGTLRANESERAALLAQVESLRAAQSLSAETIAGFLRDIGAKDVAPADYPATMARMAEQFRTLLEEAERRTNLPAALEEARLRSAEAIRQGDLDAANTLLRRIELRLAEQRQEQQVAFQQSCRDEASLKTERAGIAMTRLRYTEAASLHAEAASLLDFDAEAAWRAVTASADALANQGREFGDNAALQQAIATYDRAASLAPRERVPLDWAMTQNNLGVALVALGERESGTTRLEEAVAAFSLALEERRRDRVPLDWAMTQNNLGGALAMLGERESGTARLEEAVAAYRLALEERRRDRVPLGWAGTQNNLGVALATLGEREGGTARLEEAVAAYRLALEERRRDRVPLNWATTQNNLGNALQTLGQRESGTARLEEAVAAYRLALEECRRDRVPLNWASTQNNLGNALRTLGGRESGTARLEEAVAAYRFALEERRRDRVPLDWASTQNNLGTALATLGARESGTAGLEEAVAAYRLALEECRRDRVPLNWAMTQNNLGIALSMLGQREGGTARLEEAVAAYRLALEERRRDRVPLDWATTQNNLGTALAMLGERESGTARLEEAVAVYGVVLEERRRDRAPFLWAQTIESMAWAEQALGTRETPRLRWQSALDQVTAALEEYVRAGADYDIARATTLRDRLRERLASLP